MPTLLPQVSLVRHGETAWAVSGRHTGRSDIDLTPHGEDAARLLADRLKEIPANVVWSSPSLRARRTCELAGFASGSVVKPDLQEWDYGQYEGVTTKEIQQTTPGWRLFRDGAPGGEDVNQVGERADRIIAEIRERPIGSDLFELTLPSRACRQMARASIRAWRKLHPRHRESQHSWLRARSSGTGHPGLEYVG